MRSESSKKTGYLAVAVALLVAGTVFAQAVVKLSSGTVQQFDTVEVIENQEPGADPGVCTTSVVYEDIPLMSKVFQQGGVTSQAVVNISLQPSSFYNSPNSVYVRLLIDGVAQSGSGSDFLWNWSNSVDPLSWTFTTDPISPGAHTAKLQWRVEAEGNQPCLWDRTMTIFHGAGTPVCGGCDEEDENDHEDDGSDDHSGG